MAAMITETTTSGRYGRWRRIRLLLLLGVLLLLMLRAGLDLWMGRQIDNEIRRLEQRYGSLDESTVAAPRVPAGQNRARVVRAAAALTALPPGTTSADVMNALGRFAKSRTGPVPADLIGVVDANRAAIRLVHDARPRIQSDWEVDYPYASNHPPWMEIRILSNALYLAALLDLDAGDAEAAATTIASGLAVSASVRQEPDVLAQLMRIALAMPHLDAVQRLVVQFEPSKASLDELARLLAENRTPDPMSVALLGELKSYNAALRRTEDGNFRFGSRLTADLLPMRLASVTGASDAPFWLGPLSRLCRPLIRVARLRYLRQISLLLESQMGPRPRAALASATDSARWAWMRRLDNLSIAGLERSMETGDRFNRALSATELAVALRRYKVDHGHYPDTLAALAPAYVVALPIDPFTGQPPFYARQTAGFLLRVEQGQHSTGPMEPSLEWNVK